MAKSFLKRIEPNRSREKIIDWPFPVEPSELVDGKPPKVKMRVLGTNEREAAYFDAVDHFAKRKPKVDIGDPAFMAREKVSLVWRAFRADGEPLEPTVDEFAEQSNEIIEYLFSEWQAFQMDIATQPANKAQMDVLVAELKKNIQQVPLHAMPMSWLIELIGILASPPANSTQASVDG